MRRRFFPASHLWSIPEDSTNDQASAQAILSAQAVQHGYYWR
jgi:hypothetical protein